MRPDLKLHAVVGVAIAAYVAAALRVFGVPPALAAASAGTAALAVGYLKERIWDGLLGKGTEDTADWRYTGYSGLATSGWLLVAWSLM